MGAISNITGVSLPLAVWLASDDYDFRPGDRSISATALLRPVRQILLHERLTSETRVKPDVTERIKSRLGHAIHDSIEKAWTNNYAQALKLLGYPDNVIERVAINPEEPWLEDGQIPIYLEQRAERQFGRYTISGKLDMCIDGELNDFKSTSTYTWSKGTKDEDYRLQGSLYRWIHQDKVTSPFINIQFIFTDWMAGLAKARKDYPPQQVMEHRIELMDLKETEAWIAKRIETLETYAEAPESEIPYCEDLWREPTVWKYFSDPSKATQPRARSSKNFDNPGEAAAHRAEKGKGVVVEVPGKVKRCNYCAAAPICSQKDLYEHA